VDPVWLFDRDLTVLACIPEYDAVVETSKWSDHSTLAAKFADSYHEALDAASFITIGGGTEVYRAEYVDLVTSDDPHVEVRGRDAASMLHDRTVEWTMRWASAAPGLVISYLMASLTGDRAIANLAFGTGDTLGDVVTMERSWGDMGDVVLEVLAAAGLGIRTRLDGTTIYVDVLAPSAVAVAVGEVYGTGSGGRLLRDDTGWKNYAVVLGEGEGAARVRADVDLTGTDERKELYVDARDLQSVLTLDLSYSVATSNTLTAVGHGLANGDNVKLGSVSGGAPLANATTYYVVQQSGNTFKLSATFEGGEIDITTTGTGKIVEHTQLAAHYVNALEARGAEKLAETRRIIYAEAKTTSPLSCGALVWYDSGRWSAELIASETTKTHEGGAVSYGVTLGEPPGNVVKRVVRRWTA
jgi:hypothetical protein